MSTVFERDLLVAAVALLLVAAGLALVAGRDARRSAAAVHALLGLATAALGAAITGRWLREGQGPFLTLYDVLLSNLFSLSLLYLLAALMAPRMRAVGVAVLPFLAVLGIWLLLASAAAEPLPATFDNPWLWLHVLAGKLFLGLAMLASACALLVQSGRAGPADLRAPLWQLLSLAFVCHSFMLIAGAVWAHSAWGRYWDWDPLETWAFVTWLAMALLLHARVTYRQLPAAVAHWSVIGIFVLAFLTFFGVPFLSLAPHKGVM